jgi:hypothetical protein
VSDFYSYRKSTENAISKSTESLVRRGIQEVPVNVQTFSHNLKIQDLSGVLKG